LRNTMIGKIIYPEGNSSGTTIVNLNYDPVVRSAYIENENGTKFKLRVTENFDFDYEDMGVKIKPQKRLKGKRKRK